MIEIKTLDYYNHPELYRYMPRPIFDALEAAFFDGKPTIKISESDFIEMTHKNILRNGPENN